MRPLFIERYEEKGEMPLEIGYWAYEYMIESVKKNKLIVTTEIPELEDTSKYIVKGNNEFIGIRLWGDAYPQIERRVIEC